MQFQEIIGHNDLKERLRRMVDSDRIPHALLFGGPSGIGKMRMARAFAQYVQCTDRKDGDSCGKCSSCLQHQQFSNPDMHYEFPVLKKGKKNVISQDYMTEWNRFLNEEPNMRREHWLELIEAGNSQPVIYVSQAEEISRGAIMSNYSSGYKIYIIWLPEDMQPETANKLLKLIEEPWDHTLFLLVSNEPSRILPTIFSRTQRLNFKPLTEPEIKQYLMRKGFSQTVAERISSHSEGNLLRADELSLNKGESSEFGEIYRQMMRGAYGRKLSELYELSDRISSTGRERIMRFLNYCSHITRENFMYNLRMPQLVALSPEEEEFSQRFSPYVNHMNVEHLISEIERTCRDIGRNANAKLALYDMMLQIARYIRVGKPG